MSIIKNILLCGLCLLSMTIFAQESDSLSNQVAEINKQLEAKLIADSLRQEIEGRMLQYLDDLSQLSAVENLHISFSDEVPLSASHVDAFYDRVLLFDDKYKALDVQWNTFKQAIQPEIANNEDLMNLMTEVELMKKEISDSIDSKIEKCDALVDFADAEQLILNQDSTYKEIYKKALELSMLKKFGPQLEKLKAKEQMLFSKIQESYTKAQEAKLLIPALGKRMEILDEEFANLQVMSTKIQEMAYKPLIQRIKDYLIGLACVAVLLLFINLVVSKFKALKAARQQLKKYEEMMNKNDTDGYPTI